MIRYLEQWEKQETIPLWKEAFPEDSDKFLQYYYSRKADDNQILVAEEIAAEKEMMAAEDEMAAEGPAAEGPAAEKEMMAAEGPGQARKIVSMLHRNPNWISVGGKICRSDYIVAVATAEDRRHRGLMSALLKRMMSDMYQEGMGFCFLMPADRRIYEPFDFAFIYDQPHWRLKPEIEEIVERRRIPRNPGAQKASRFAEASGECVSLAAQWMNRWLEERYQVFAWRDESYVNRLLAELDSEDGWMEFLYSPEDKDSISGIRCWWGAKELEQRMLLCPEEWRETEKQDTPVIMARIIHLENFLKNICLKADCGQEVGRRENGSRENAPQENAPQENAPREVGRQERLVVRLAVEDRLCAGNQGTFLWEITKKGSKVQRISEAGCGAGRSEAENGCGAGRSEAETAGQEAGRQEETVAALIEIHTGIASLAQWLFGYKNLDLDDVKAGDPGLLKQIQVLAPVFLDEVV